MKWYGGDPEAYFSDLTRSVDDLYKKHCLAQLKKEFRTTTVATIDKVFKKHNSLYVPSFRALIQHQAPKRKTKRPDHECGHPKEISLNFLKVKYSYQKLFEILNSNRLYFTLRLEIIHILISILGAAIFKNRPTSH